MSPTHFRHITHTPHADDDAFGTRGGRGRLRMCVLVLYAFVESMSRSRVSNTAAVSCGHTLAQLCGTMTGASLGTTAPPLKHLATWISAGSCGMVSLVRCRARSQRLLRG